VITSETGAPEQESERAEKRERGEGGICLTLKVTHTGSSGTYITKQSNTTRSKRVSND